MALEVILGVVIITLAIVAGVVYWMWKRTENPATYYKIIEDGNSRVYLQAHQDLGGVEVRDRIGKEKLKFARSNIKKGEEIEFVYPVSMKSAHIVFYMNNEEHVVHAEPRSR